MGLNELGGAAVPAPHHDDLAVWVAASDAFRASTAGTAAVGHDGSHFDDVLRACAYAAAALEGRTDGDADLMARLLHGRATLDDIARRDPRGVEAEADVRAGFEALHMALDLAELGGPVSGTWLQAAHATLERSESTVDLADDRWVRLASRLCRQEVTLLHPVVQAAFAHASIGHREGLGDAGHRLAGVVASVILLRDRRLPSFVPLERWDDYRVAVIEAREGRPGDLVTIVADGVEALVALLAQGPSEPIKSEPPAVPEELPAMAPVVEAQPEPSSTEAAEEPHDDEGDALPADLDISAYVGQYTFPDIHRRRIPGYIYLGVATACFLFWVTRHGDDPVMVNNGLAVAAFGFLLVGWYHLATAWPLEVKDTDALMAAAREVGFPVGHASAQLGWRGLRSRPTWRILVYSSEDPPAQRGLVLVDGTDGTVLSHFTETNPEDWSQFDMGKSAGAPPGRT